jgi:hypothetical protein
MLWRRARNEVIDAQVCWELATIDATFAWVSRLLSGQKKNDFRPRESDNTAWLEINLLTQANVASMVFCSIVLILSSMREVVWLVRFSDNTAWLEMLHTPVRSIQHSTLKKALLIPRQTCACACDVVETC